MYMNVSYRSFNECIYIPLYVCKYDSNHLTLQICMVPAAFASELGQGIQQVLV